MAPLTPGNVPALQRTLGNQRVTRLIHTTSATVQRHPIVAGVHTSPGKHKAHTKEEGERALVEANRVFATTDAALALAEDAKSTASQVEAVRPGVAEALKQITLQRDIANGTTSIGQVRTVFQRMESRAAKIGAAVADKEKAVRQAHAKQLSQLAPTKMHLAERALLAAIGWTKDVQTATDAKRAAALAAKVRAEADRATEFAASITSLADEVKEFPGTAAFVSAHQRAADEAKAAAAKLAESAERIAAKLLDVEAKKKAADDIRAALAELEAAEAGVAEAEANLTHVEGFAESLNESLDEITGTPEAHEENIALMRADAAEKVKTATEAKKAAETRRTAAREEVSRLGASKKSLEGAEAETAAAEQEVPLAVAAAGAEASTATSGLEANQGLRGKAGDEVKLAPLLEQIPDKALLDTALDALGYDQLDRWLRDNRVGKAGVTGLLASFGKDGLKSFISDISAGDILLMLGSFTPAEMKTMSQDEDLGVTKLKALLAAFSCDEIKKFVTTLTLPKLKDFLDTFTAKDLKDTGLSAVQLGDYLGSYNASELKTRFDDLGKPALADFLKKFTAAEFKVYETTVGYERLKTLVVEKKLKSDALFKYKADWLKVFVGAGPNALAHVLNIYTKGDGVISGGHDTAVFTGELNRIIRGAPPPPQTNGAVINVVADNANFRKVTYRTFNPDGTPRATGSKTLMKGLSTQPAVWTGRANEAIWKSIRTLAFDRTSDAWSGTSDGGIAFGGFYTDPRVEVETFYPT